MKVSATTNFYVDFIQDVQKVNDDKCVATWKCL